MHVLGYIEKRQSLLKSTKERKLRRAMINQTPDVAPEVDVQFIMMIELCSDWYFLLLVVGQYLLAYQAISIFHIMAP